MATKKSTRVGIDSAYKAFLENVDLFALGLDSLSAEIKRTAYAQAMSSKKSSSVVRQVTSDFHVANFDTGHFDVNADFFLSISFANETLLSVNATFSAHCHPKVGSFIEQNVERFAHSEARLIFWPYFRQTVADLTARMHIRPVTIPLTFAP